MGRTRAVMPRARTEDLVVEELPEETLVYDLKRHTAHCLNGPAAVVWRHSDGQTSTTQLAKILAEESELPHDEGIVRFALNRLQKAKLLEGTNIPKVAAGHSRRELVKRLALGGLAMLLPVVTTMVAPVPAMAASTVSPSDCNKCIGLGLPCTGGGYRTCLVDAQKGGCKCQ